MTQATQANLKRVRRVRESIGIVVRLLSNKRIPVYQKGSDAYVSWNPQTLEARYVNIPVIPDDASTDFLDAVEGFVDHEVGHILETDPMATIEASNLSPRINTLRNIVEDTRIERRMQEIFAGSGTNLKNLHQLFLNRMVNPAIEKLQEQGEVTEQEWFNVLAASMVRAWSGQPAFIDFMDDKWHLVPGIVKACEDLRELIPQCESNWDSLDVAKEMQRAIYGEENPTPSGGKDGSNQKQQEQGEKGESDQPGERQGESEPESESESESESEEKEGSSESSEPKAKPKEGEDDDEGDSESDGSGGPGESDELDDDEASDTEVSDDEEQDEEEDEEPTKATKQSPLGAGDDQSKPQDFDDSVEEMVKKMAISEASHSNYIPYATYLDIIEPIEIPQNYDPHWYERMESSVKNMIGPMQKQLERAFLANNKSRWEAGKRSGRISPSSLHRLTSEDDRVFRRREEIKTREVAVSLMIDMSGSMTEGNRLGTACATAWALAEVLARLKINNEVIGFTTKQPNYSQEANEVFNEWESDADNKRTYARGEPIYMPIVKAFDEPFAITQKKRLASVPMSAHSIVCRNIDGESLRYGADRLLRQKQPGKTIIWLSDGMPNSWRSDRDELNAHLAKTAKDVERQGINVVGVGINTNSVSQFFRKSIILNDVKDLPTQVMTELRRVILEK